MQQRSLILVLLFLMLGGRAIQAKDGPVSSRLKSKKALLDAPPYCRWAKAWILLQDGENDLWGRTATCELTARTASLLASGRRTNVTPNGETLVLEPKGDHPLRIRVQRLALPPQWQDGDASEISERWIAFLPEVQTARVGRTTVSCYDLNANGTYWETDGDGVLLEGSNYILPLGASIIVGSARFSLKHDADGLRILRTETMRGIDGNAGEMEAVVELNRHRVGAGLPPVWLSVAKSVACKKHCEYLQRTGTHSTDVNWHEEDPRSPHFTKDGAAAGRRSEILRVADAPYLVRTMLAWLFHKPRMLTPSISEIGVASRHGWTLLDAREGGDTGMAAGRPQAVCHPAHGQTTDILTYNGCEIPRPVPLAYGQETGACLTAYFGSHASLLTGATGNLRRKKGRTWVAVDAWFSSPEQPANRARARNEACLAFFPKKPLVPDAQYRVRFEFMTGDDGKKEVLEWSFRTAKQRRSSQRR